MKKINIWQSRDSLKTIATALTLLINYSNMKHHFLFTFANPLKVCILIIEMINILINKTLFNKSALLTVRIVYINFCKLYIKKLQDETLLFELLRDADIEGRKLIYIIYENSLLEFFEIQNLQDVVEIMWNGNIICNNGVFSFFSITQNLARRRYNSNLQRIEKRFFVHNKDFLSQNFILQKAVWRYDCWLKNLFDQVTIYLFVRY